MCDPAVQNCDKHFSFHHDRIRLMNHSFYCLYTTKQASMTNKSKIETTFESPYASCFFYSLRTSHGVYIAKFNTFLSHQLSIGHSTIFQYLPCHRFAKIKFLTKECDPFARLIHLKKSTMFHCNISPIISSNSITC